LVGFPFSLNWIVSFIVRSPFPSGFKKIRGQVLYFRMKYLSPNLFPWLKFITWF